MEFRTFPVVLMVALLFSWSESTMVLNSMACLTVIFAGVRLVVFKASDSMNSKPPDCPDAEVLVQLACVTENCRETQFLCITHLHSAPDYGQGHGFLQPASESSVHAQFVLSTRVWRIGSISLHHL